MSPAEGRPIYPRERANEPLGAPALPTIRVLLADVTKDEGVTALIPRLRSVVLGDGPLASGIRRRPDDAGAAARRS